MSVHFVVTIDIKQVSSGEQTSSSVPNYANRAPVMPSERSITDLIHVVVKADTKEEAIVKANGILAIS